VNTLGSMPESSIVISWSMTEPSLKPKKWHQFVQKAENAEPSALEKAMSWPAGTVAILEDAFELHLSRSIGWQLDQVSNKEAYVSAAKIFRRGVAHSSQRPRELSGTYRVAFHSSQKPSDLLKIDGPIIIDSNVAKAWQITPRLEDLSLHLDEASKSLSTAAKIIEWIKRHPGTVTIVGGGILADVAAFSAALADRPFRLVPTTLLAMLDACVGGKTGVNFGRFGKNQLGLFAFPTEVIISSNWLQTLSEREFKAGLAEAYKHAVISGDKALAKKVASLDFSKEAVEPLLEELVNVKAKIISQDPSEAGIRAVLNFGHTLAHAIEKVSHEFSPEDPILHGEAIGIGMLFALSLSHKLGELDVKIFQEIKEQLLAARFLITKDQFQRQLGLRKLKEQSLINLFAEAVLQDKKNQNQGSTEWVLLKDWGEFVTRGSLYTAPVKGEVFRELCSSFLIETGLIEPQYVSKL
jgi:3-dehydroquinate synthetase